jgi:hypothetical protein
MSLQASITGPLELARIDRKTGIHFCGIRVRVILDKNR